MKTVVGIALALILGFSLPALADGVTASKAWSRATSPANKTGAAFITLDNSGPEDRLVAASSPVAAKVEFHAHQHQDGVMRMRQQPAILLPAKGQVTFAPSGLHLMLVDLKAPLTVGQTFPLTLTFAKSAPVTIPVMVEALGASALTEHNHDHEQHMKDPDHKAMHEQHMKDPAHKAMHEHMHGPGK